MYQKLRFFSERWLHYSNFSAIFANRLEQIWEKLNRKLGQEFLYSFYENPQSYKFFCVESDFTWLHREKCSDFRLSRRFQNGRPLTRYMEVWSPWGYVISNINPKLISFFIVYVSETFLVIVTSNITFLTEWTGGHYTETLKYA